MLVDGAGQIIVDAFTANRSYASIPSASSLLDTSNYTIQAVSFGKDAAGFNQHAHQIIEPSSTRVIKVLSYGPINFSSYQTSTTASALELTYRLFPWSPTPMDTRLEMKSTLPNYSSGVPDVGHCLNSVIDPSLSSFHHLIGCFPASGGTTYWMVSSVTNASASVIVSAVVSSFFNSNSIMDTLGYLTFAAGNNATNVSLSSASNYTSGALKVINSTSGSIDVLIPLRTGDAGALLLYGGLYQLGLWVLDIRETLKQGITAPFPFNSLNNKRKYKLFAKKTFNKDLLFCTDYTGISGMRSLFAQGGALNNEGSLTITWRLNFI